VRLLIVVGLTGVGKTTTVRALPEAGFDFEQLPNRRSLTDELIIGTIQDRWQEPRHRVADRAERFAYTRQYRQLFPGGMAHALSQIAVHAAAAGDPDWWLFDGLRGADEVDAAVSTFPRAHFLLLHASDQTRIERLLRRADKFDVMALDEATHEALSTFTLGQLGDFLSPTAVSTLEKLVHHEIVLPRELRAKVKIVRTERENYDPDAAKAILHGRAPERTIFANTEQTAPADIAAQLIAHLQHSA
jgi:DNA polymerase III delta prime subunit